MILRKFQNIDCYTVLFFIKKGDYAETYRVKDIEGNLRFLKLIDLAKLEPSQFDKDNNVLEIEIAKKLHNPNICEYINSGSIICDGQEMKFVVYDFISGETVSQKCIREKHCSVYDAKQIALAVLNGLKFLHTLPNPIIHNEITSQNVMLDMTTDPSVPKLIDFGYAQYLNSPIRKPSLKGINPFYLSPERLNGVYSVQSDLYSVGVMIYHLLFGLMPWFIDLSTIKPSERLESLLKEKSRPLKMPSMDIFELDEQLINTIIKSTSYDVGERFQTSDDFIKALNGELVVEKLTLTKEVDDRFIHNKRGNGFADVAGMDKLKEQMQTDIIDMLHNPRPYKEMGLSLPNGALFYGPPGCGKTFFAEKFAEEVGRNYIYVKCSDIASPYIHGGQTKIAEIFELAKKDAPTILFFDEIEAMITDRSKQNNVSESGEVNEFLTQMSNCGENGVFVIGATNKPNIIDKAALRAGRLEMKFYIPNPDYDSRVALFKLYLQKRSEINIDYENLAWRTEYMVSVDIKLITDNAARIAIKRNLKKITMDILNEVLSSFKPTVSIDEIHQHEKIRDFFEGNINQQRPHIGFK